MADFAGERTEEATPRRRQEARRKGTVAKSTELTNSAVVLALMFVLPAVAAQLGSGMMLSVEMGFTHIPETVTWANVQGYTALLLRPLALAMLPVFAVAMIVGLGANFAQVGFVLSGESLNPSLAKLNPLEGMKRLVSARSLMEGAKATAKTALFGYLAWTVLQAHWERLLSLAWSPAGGALATIGVILKAIFMKVAIAWLVLAVIDYIFQRKQVEKSLRMTKEEVKQEFRQNEQSPEMRGAMAQRRRKLLKGRVGQAVKTADVVITNPTHFSVAIKYDPKGMFAPQVVAKGADLMAFKIRELAKEARVPIVPNPPLARQLYKKCEVGDSVPRELFQAVAEVLAYVYATLKRVRA